MIREFYMIRHKQTGGFLPEVNKGYTFSEPTWQGVPRLFSTRGGAQRALTWWLNGITSVTKTGGQWGYGEPEYDEVWNLEKRPDRIKEDMEVILVLLKT